jgi:hypothetical protein
MNIYELAFPVVHEFKNGHEFEEYGLTKREYFAGLAMLGLSSAHDKNGNWTGLDCTNEAVDIADALLKKLQETK